MKLVRPPLRRGRVAALTAWFVLTCAVLTNRVAAQAEWDEAETLALLVRTIGQTDTPEVRANLLQGMLKGLEGRRDLTSPRGWHAVRAKLAASEDARVRELSAQLSRHFGDAAALEQAWATLDDATASIDRRRTALGSLLQQRAAGLAGRLAELMKIPELRLDVIRGFSVLGPDDGPRVLLAWYDRVPAPERRAILETLASRASYAEALVDAIDQGRVDRDEVPSYTARQLKAILGQHFIDVYGPVPELNTDVAGKIAEYKQKITAAALQQADAGRGRAVFEKTCAACHLMYGSGGRVGPDLTGSNRANLDYLLLNSVAPSADVPEGYRTQLVQTIDGRIITGVLAEEDARRVILKTAEQPRVVIAKTDIEARKVSEKSMMPEGQLDQLSQRELLDLVKYMQTTTQVEAAQ